MRADEPGHASKIGGPFHAGLPEGHGLWDRWDKQGDARETCTILTCDANEPMRVIHDRMPVVIPPESFEIWLDPAVNDVDNLSRLLRPFHSDEMTAYQVSTLVNNVRNDSPKLVDSLPPPEKQARLFSSD